MEQLFWKTVAFQRQTIFSLIHVTYFMPGLDDVIYHLGEALQYFARLSQVNGDCQNTLGDWYCLFITQGFYLLTPHFDLALRSSLMR